MNMKRMNAYLHNGLRGSVAMSKAQMRNISKSPTTTMEAKKLALDILPLLNELDEALKKRVDTQESLMTKRIGNTIIICEQSNEICELCGAHEECRPYGPDFKNICFSCSEKDPEGTQKRMLHKLFGDPL